MRTGRVLSCLVALWAATGVAQAHARLQSSVPSDGGVLAASPQALVLQFSEAPRRSALGLQRGGGERQKLPLPQQPQTRITIPLPALAAGDYVVGWRGLGSDGHVVPGGL